MKVNLITLIFLFFGFTGYATTWYTCGSGNWTNNFGSTTIRVATTPDCSTTLRNPWTIPWGTGDKIIIQAGHTVNVYGNILDVDNVLNFSIEVFGSLLFNEPANSGILNLDATGTIVLWEGSTLGCIDGDCNNPASQVRIGTTNYTGDDIDDLNNCDKPCTITPSGALPVELISFTGRLEKSSVFLNWSTASEENFDYFTIERSVDALNYEILGTVEGNGWSENIINYSFVDQNPIIGRNYYRLKATDLDNTIEYFNPIMVNFLNGNNKIKVLQNPVSNRNLEFSLNFTFDEKLDVNITNVSGATVYEGQIEPGRSKYSIKTEFDKGVYIMKVFSDNDVHMVRFIQE